MAAALRATASPLSSGAHPAAARGKSDVNKFFQDGGAKSLKLSAPGLDEKTLESQMKKLGNVTNNKRAARKMARNKDAIQQLIQTMTTKPKFSKMVEYSIECLKNLAVDEVSIEEMIDEGVLETLMNIAKLNPYNENIQRMINQTIKAFCINEHLAKMVGERIGASNIVFSLKKHVEPETLATTLQAAVKMMQHAPNVDMLVKGGIIGALKNVMKNCEEHPDVLIAATAALAKIAENPAYAKEIVESGVLSDVLEALRHFPENATLVSNALEFLFKISANSKEAQEELKRLGAVDVLVQALEQHPDNARLLELGAQALRYLASEGDMVASIAVQVGSNEQTALALQKISALLLVDENVDFMVQNQGIQWLINALQAVLGDQSETASKILASGCRALGRMATDETNIYNIMQHGGVKLLIAIIDQHLKDETVVAASLNALAKMVTRKENAVYIVKSGGIRAAKAALEAHPNSETIAKAAMELFQRIAAHEECVPLLIEHKAIDATVALMKGLGKSNATIAVQAINTLGRAATSAPNVKALAAAGALGAIVGVLNSLQKDADVVRPALLLLETTALVKENVEELRKLGATEAILGVLEAHPTDAEIQAVGARALALIAGEQQLKQAVEYVGQMGENLLKNPGLIAASIDKLLNAVKLVGNLAMVDANVPALIKNGAVKALINAFNAAAKAPPSEKRTQLLNNAAAGLLRLAKASPECATQICQTGALKQMLQTALKEPDNEELAQHVAQLAAVCASNPANIPQMLKEGIPADLVALAKAHPLNEQILSSVTKALGLMCGNDDVAKKMVGAGAAEIVVESMLANLENKELLKNALGVLNQLAVDEAACEALVKAGAIDAILEAFRAHQNDPEILTLCCHSLCRLLVSEAIAEEIGLKGGIPLFIKAMREQYQSEPLAEIDMILLDSLASLPANAGRLLDPELNTIELVKWIGNFYAKNKPLNEAMEKLVSTLTQPSEEDKKKLVITDEKFDEAKCDIMLNKLKKAKVDKQECLNMLKNMVHNLQDPRNAEMLIARGGLQALAELMANSKDDETMFYSAANAFLTLADKGGDGVVEMLEDPSLIQALCSCINAHELFPSPMNLDDLTKAVASSAKIKLKPATVTEMIKNKPLSSLMKIVTQSDDPLLLAQAARLLGKLSNNNDAALLLSKIANLRELINAIRRNIKNEEFLKYGVYLLANLAINDELKSQIGIEGGIQVILQIMDMYPNNEPLIENCAYALANLSFGNEVNVSFIIACKGVPIILNAMHQHSKAVELLESCVSVLCNCCHKNDNNKDLILKLSGAQAIVDTVLNNFNSIDLLLTCFRTLGNLAYDARSTTAIVKAGGVQGIVAGMTVHNTDLDIIDTAIKVLINLASDPTEETMKIMAAEGAVQAIVEVAAQYTDKLDIEVAALACLCNLGRSPENASMIIRQGGVDATVKTMKTLDFDAALVQNAVRLISILAYGLPQDVDKIIDSGATDAIVAAIKGHAGNRGVVSFGLTAFTLLAYSADAATRMGQAGVIQLILKLVQENQKLSAVLIECFPPLSALARSESNAVSMAELTFKALVNSLNAHSADARFLPYAFNVLANLCVHSSASEFAVATQIVSGTLRALLSHSQIPDVLLRGLRGLENMAFSTDEVRNHMKKEGVIEAVTQIMKENEKNDDVKEACRAVIDALNRSDISLDAMPFKQIKMGGSELKSAKKLFGDEEVKVDVKELPVAIKNLLLAGALLIKHSNTAEPRKRHVYLTSDLKYIIWKDPKQAVHPDNKMKVFKIRTVEKGRVTPQLQRKRFGKLLAKEECSFAIIGRERTVDLEAGSETERDKWVEALDLLVQYTKAQKKAATQFVK